MKESILEHHSLILDLYLLMWCPLPMFAVSFLTLRFFVMSIDTAS